MRINVKLCRGVINKHLLVNYVYRFEPTGEFATVQDRPNGSVSIYPSYGISISEGFEKDSIYVPANQFFTFSTLLTKSVKLIQDNLYELFPNVNRAEFEIDSKAFDRFQTEKAVTSDGISMLPAVWVDGETNQCHPGIMIRTMKYGSVCVPLQDAIPIEAMLARLDPIGMSISMLRICGRIQ